MKFDFYECDELDKETVDSLWKQGVNMDDWDYLLFFHAKYKCKFPVGFDQVTIEPSSYLIDGLLRGSCRNKWYPVQDFKGRKGIMGVAYHA